jgi:hypothetical protein
MNTHSNSELIPDFNNHSNFSIFFCQGLQRYYYTYISYDVFHQGNNISNLARRNDTAWYNKEKYYRSC